MKDTFETIQETVRYRYVRASFYMLIRLMSDNPAVEVENPLPKGTKFVRAGYDSMGNIFLVVEHESFDEVRLNEEIPFHGEVLFRMKVN